METFLGKTVEEALAEACAKFGVSADRLSVTVTEHGSKGLFGLGSKMAAIDVELMFDPEQTARDFLREVFAHLGMSMTIKITTNEKNMNVDITGDNIGILIGKRGQTLDALEYILSLVVNKGNGPYIGITLDTEGYRQKRKETLSSLARNLARKAKTTRKSVYLEPMSANERRIIHYTLQNDKSVSTQSEGDERGDITKVGCWRGVGFYYG
jgi:spoIIIJ-associated protein